MPEPTGFTSPGTAKRKAPDASHNAGARLTVLQFGESSRENLGLPDLNHLGLSLMEDRLSKTQLGARCSPIYPPERSTMSSPTTSVSELQRAVIQIR